MSTDTESCAVNADISADVLAKFRSEFNSDSKNILAMNVVTRHETLASLRTREATVRTISHEYSTRIKKEGKPVTAQQSTGRCWLFAFLNTARIPFCVEHKLSDFEFSQPFLYFYDKYERSNFFLEQIIDTWKEPLDGRLVQHLLSKPQEDGGQYDMIINIVEKYGVCPKELFPETSGTKSSRTMNRIVNCKLREYALKLRSMAAAEAGSDSLSEKVLSEMRALKMQQLSEIYRILCIHLGEPPLKFEWQCKNSSDELIRFPQCTPNEFYEKYVRKHVDVSQMVSLVNDPRNEYYKAYTVDRLMNVIGGVRSRVLYINVPIEVLKEVTAAELKKDKPVWFGCHVSQYYWSEDGIMDTRQYDYPLLFGVGSGYTDDRSLMLSSMTKADRLESGESLMSHAMVFTGVDEALKAGAPSSDEKEDESSSRRKYIKWRVENSWSEKRGHKGYCMMTDEWFDEFNYQVCVPKSILPDEVKAVLTQEPVVFPPWDPMGALAQ